MKTNMTATFLLSATLGVALAFAAAVGTIVFLPGDHSFAVSPYDLVSVTQKDLIPGPALASTPLTMTVPPTETPSPSVPQPVAAASDSAAIAEPTATSSTSPSALVAVSTVEETAPGPLSVVAVGDALLAQAGRTGLPDVRAAGAFIAAQLPPLTGE
jgi:hypothetical protein